MKKLLPNLNLYFNILVLVVSIIAWPVTALTIFSEEPPGILGLSWMAIIIGCIGNVITSVIQVEQKK